MSALVECDTALDRQGNEIHIRDAASGAQGYFCRSCGAEMVAHQKRRRNEAHFQHRPRFSGEVFDCIWSNESYRHKVAKRIIHEFRQLKLPALYPIRPDDYEGPLPRILESEILLAHEVLTERCIYEDNQGRTRFARALEFDQDPEGKVLLVRPDLTFRNARKEPILFVEICVTHTPDDRKLARLIRLGIPTIEIQIPACHSEKELAYFLTHTTTSSRWLYHPKQYVYQPDATSPFHTGRRSRVSTSNKRRLLGFESVKCRSIRVEDALRGVGKFLAGTDHADRRTAAAASLIELAAEEERLEGIVREKQGKTEADERQVAVLVASADADLAPINRRANAEVQRRVESQRQVHRAAAAAIRAAADELANKEKSYRETFNGRFLDASTKLKAAGATTAAEFDQVEADIRNQYREYEDITREETALEREEAELATAEAAARTSLETAQRARLEQERATGETANRFATAYGIELQIGERKRALARKEEQARSGRLDF